MLLGTWSQVGGWPYAFLAPHHASHPHKHVPTASSTAQLLVYIVSTVALCAHPLPSVAEGICRSWLIRATYCYFSYRFVWCDDAREKAKELKPW